MWPYIASASAGRNAEPNYTSVYGHTKVSLEKTSEGESDVLRFDATALVTQQDQICSAANSELCKKIGNVEFHRTF
jgi:hypothetical protein